MSLAVSQCALVTASVIVGDRVSPILWLPWTSLEYIFGNIETCDQRSPCYYPCVWMICVILLWCFDCIWMTICTTIPVIYIVPLMCIFLYLIFAAGIKLRFPSIVDTQRNIALTFIDIC